MTTIIPLSEKEQRIYDFIKSYYAKNDRSPSLTEIKERFGYRNVSSVQDFIVQLKNKGYLRVPLGSNKKRAIELVGGSEISDVERLPLLGYVAAGYPVEAVENRDYVDLPRSLFRPNAEYFALRVKGNSMIEDCIMDGDLVIIRRQSVASDGETVVALIDNEATIKRFYKKRDWVELHPANPKYKVIKVDNGSAFKILGVLASVFRRHE